MAKSKLIPIKVNNHLIDKALADIYKNINLLVDKTSISVSDSSPIGSVRAVYNKTDKIPKIEGKTSAGWISSPAQINSNARAYINAPKITSRGTLDVTSLEAISLSVSDSFTMTATRPVLTANGPFTIDCSSNIELNADGGSVTMSDNIVTGFTFDMLNDKFSVHNSADPNNKCMITASANGATSISTQDIGGQAGHLTLDPDGQVKINPEGTQNQGVYIDFDTAHTTDKTCTAFFVDTDQTGIVASGQTLNITNIDNRLNADSPTMVGTVNAYGIKNLVTCGTSGTQAAYGIWNETVGADTNVGLYSKLTDGLSNNDIKMVSSANTSDFCLIRTGANGATRIHTIDDDAAEAHLELIADGHVEISAALANSGDSIHFQNEGTTISAYQVHHGATWLYLYENGGASTSDYLALQTEANGESKIWTYDAGGTDAHLEINADGDITLDAASGNIYVKDAGGNYTPGSDYEIATKKYVDDNAGGGDYYIHNSGRARTQYNNWYYGASTMYGYSYYYWTSTTNSTSIPSIFYDSFAPGYLVPKNGTVKAYTIIGNISTTDTWEWILMKGAQPTYGSAGNYSLSQVGSTQSAGGTANILYKWEETGLSVAVNAGDMLLPYFRRTTDNDTSYSYAEVSMVITLG